MILIYGRPTCPYTKKVLGALDALQVPFELMNVEEETHRKALIEKGGSSQIPYMIDPSTERAMYESDDIITYLETTYGMGTSIPRDDNSPGTCSLD